MYMQNTCIQTFSIHVCDVGDLICCQMKVKHSALSHYSMLPHGVNGCLVQTALQYDYQYQFLITVLISCYAYVLIALSG